MSLSSPFIRRPVGTSLLTAAVTLAGALAYVFLPVSPLPQVEFPTISVSATLPGASPETMASAVATPLERQFGRIAGITEMSSASLLGSTSITIQFDLSRNIDAAARDIQAAINAASGQLPANLPSKPTYRKVNPSDSAILIPALTSDVRTKPEIYDAASSILAQKVSQIDGVGQVFAGGGSPPAVRIEVNPTQLNNWQLGLDDVRTMIGTATVNRPKGSISQGAQNWFLGTTDQLLKAKEYTPLIVAYRNGAPVRLGDVAKVTDSVEDVRASGLYDLKPSVLLIIFRQPGANIIETVDRIRDAIPQLKNEIPAGIDIDVVVDRSSTIRASVRDVEMTLGLSVGLVILVVFLFLRNGRATLIPSVAVPVSLIGTFGVMYLCGYSVDNLSLMGLTISTGFVVDDAIVVVENINRHLEAGMRPMQASLLGAREIGFTVLSISVSLVAVFIPILLMGGIIGRLFREFAVTISAAIAVSLVVSLTTTPMMCAWLLKAKDEEKHGYIYRASEAVFQWILNLYEAMLRWVFRHQFLMILATLFMIGVSFSLYVVVPKGFFPQQDTSRLNGMIQADQDTSFQAMDHLMTQFAKSVGKDPDVVNVIAFTGGGGAGGRSTNTGTMYVSLKPVEERTVVHSPGPISHFLAWLASYRVPVPGRLIEYSEKITTSHRASADDVIGRMRQHLAGIPGATLYLQSVQDLRIGGRTSSAQYQYTLQGDNLKELNEWGPKVLNKLRTIPDLVDVSSDQQNSGLEATVTVDRVAASRLGITMQTIDDALYDAFGQRFVATTYTQLNQYHVVMTVPPEFWQNPNGLRFIYVKGANGVRVPLSTFCRFKTDTGPLQVNHSGVFPSVTISFNLPPGGALGDAVEQISAATRELGIPSSLHGRFQGAAQAFQDSLKNEPILIAAALAAVYIVLGILYESYMHPVTILSTIPSAGVGALLALWLTGNELNVMGLIGILLLIGIVKKNAIMMIDFALEAERKENMSSVEAIYTACVLRFRPIMMTTLAALFGGLPLALGTGTGSELRRPLGIAIVGGLIVSQALTLFTTPVVYLYLDRFRLWVLERRRQRHEHSAEAVLAGATGE
jgi:multidrug efflux pump